MVYAWEVGMGGTQGQVHRPRHDQLVPPSPVGFA